MFVEQGEISRFESNDRSALGLLRYLLEAQHKSLGSRGSGKNRIWFAVFVHALLQVAAWVKDLKAHTEVERVTGEVGRRQPSC